MFEIKGSESWQNADYFHNVIDLDIQTFKAGASACMLDQLTSQQQAHCY